MSGSEQLNDQTKSKIIRSILQRPQNKTCADCSANEPTWASLKFGVWVCLRCSSYHRNLGANITRIKSATLDQWEKSELDVFNSIDNEISNKYWEATLDPFLKIKPSPEHEVAEGLSFVKRKYIERKWVAPDNKNPVENYKEFMRMALEDLKSNPSVDSQSSLSPTLRTKNDSQGKSNMFDGLKVKRQTSRDDHAASQTNMERQTEAEQERSRRKSSLPPVNVEPSVLQQYRDLAPQSLKTTDFLLKFKKDIEEAMERTKTKRIPTKFYNYSIKSRDNPPRVRPGNQQLSQPTNTGPTQTSAHPLASSSQPETTPRENLTKEENYRLLVTPPTSLTPGSKPQIAVKVVDVTQLVTHLPDYLRPESNMPVQTWRFRLFWNTVEAIQSIYRDKKGECLVAGGFLLQFVLGSVYMWGTLAPYVTSYFHSFDEDISYNQTNITFAVGLIGTSIAQPFGVRIGKRFGFQRALVAFCVAYAASMYLSSMATNFYVFLMLFSFLPGVCCGLIYMIPIYCAWEYFPGREGTVSGIINCAFGFSAMFFSTFCYWIINPNNAKPMEEIEHLGVKVRYFDSEIYEMVPSALQQVAMVQLALFILGIFLIRPKSQRKPLIEALLEYDKNYKVPLPKRADDPHILQECPSVIEGLLSNHFRDLFILMIASSIAGFYVATNYKVFGLIWIQDDMFISMVGGMGTALNGLSRIAWAAMLDRIKFKSVCNLLLVVQGILIVTLGLFGKSYLGFSIWVMTLLVCEGFVFPVFPVLAKRVFGMKYCTEMYGLLFCSFPVANLINYLLSRWILPIAGYEFTFVLFLVPIIVGYQICDRLKEHPIWHQLPVEIEMKHA